MRALPHLLPPVIDVEWPSPPVDPGDELGNEYLQQVIAHGLLYDEDGPLFAWPPCERSDADPFDDPGNRRYANRELLRRRYSWAIPNQRALEALTELAPLLELGAGGGYWTMLLRERDVDIVAYDRDPPPATEDQERWWAWRRWTDVDQGGIEQAARYPQRTLMLSWPSPGTWQHCWAANALQAYAGQTVAFIGEPAGGCTGSIDFHQLLEKRFALHEEIEIPRFVTTQDLLTIWRRRGKCKAGAAA